MTQHEIELDLGDFPGTGVDGHVLAAECAGYQAPTPEHAIPAVLAVSVCQGDPAMPDCVTIIFAVELTTAQRDSLADVVAAHTAVKLAKPLTQAALWALIAAAALALGGAASSGLLW